MLCCNYDILDKHNNSTKNYRSVACFSSIHENISLFHKIRVFILEDYKKGGYYDNKLQFSLKEVNEFISYLNQIGFQVEPIKKCIIEYNDVYNENCSGYSVDILTSKMSDSAGLICTNAIRYLYENDFWYIVKRFLEWAPLKSDISLWNKFQLSHYEKIGYYNDWHTFIHTSSSYSVSTLILPQEEQEFLFDTNLPCNSVEYLFPRFSVTRKERQNLSTAVNISLEEAIKVYKEISLGKEVRESCNPWENDDGFNDGY